MNIDINYRRLGWKRDKPDGRDLYWCPHPQASGLPATVDLMAKMPFIYDQGQAGSCTSQMGARMWRFLHPDVQPSRLMIYYDTREIEGTADQDSGGEIRDVLKALSSKGACRETSWPYDLDQLTVKPPPSAYHEAIADHTFAKLYARVPQSLVALKSCLAHGYPFGFGFNIYASFTDGDAATTGVMPMPDPGEDVQGGHAVAAVGYDDLRRAFLIANSWGERWGAKGCFWMPYAFIADANYCTDFWVLKGLGA